MIEPKNTMYKTSLSLIIVAAFGLSASIAQASIPTPRLKPAPSAIAIAASQPISSEDRLFRSAFKAAKKGRWAEVASTKGKLANPVAKDLLTWMEVTRKPGLSMEKYTYATTNLSDWPRMVSVRSKAEAKLFDNISDARDTINWFGGQDPVSGEGRAALARAYYTIGNDGLGDMWLKKAWREARLTRDRQKRIYAGYKNKLTPDDHAARADYLMWLGRAHHTNAQALLPLMNKDERAVMNARLRLSGNRPGITAAIEDIPAHMQRDTGFLYERAKWRRRKKSKDYALPVYKQINAPARSEAGKKRVWRERKIMAYWLIEDGRFAEAYEMTQHHGMTRGSGFAAAEFLAGWLALKLNKPDVALKHFETLKGGVSTPVSLSRASYWMGRAQEAMNDGSSVISYADASQFKNTFYGFLAGQRLSGGGHNINLPLESDAQHLSAEFESDRRIQALRLLGEAGEEHYFNVFAFHMDDELATQEHLTLLASLAKQYGYMKPSLRAAKQASRFQTMLTESGYPMPDAITTLGSEFNTPFVLAIARQESEFNYRAVSHARAYGMMQMINATAKRTARKHRVPYNRSRMTRDINYSAKLGALHLHDLLDQFDGSYIMAAAAYNAGPSRVNKWNRVYGDPRKGEIDPVDWLESIPFSETRNYVQRVMENLQVYRARMNGNMAANQVHNDITNGAF